MHVLWSSEPPFSASQFSTSVMVDFRLATVMVGEEDVGEAGR